MTPVRIPKAFSTLLVLFAWVHCDPGIAQQSTTQPSPTALQEIVVTAQKRESSIQATPISMSAITGSELDVLGITSTAAALAEVPGVAAISAGPGQTQYEIRGLSNAGGQSPTVGFYLDEMPISPLSPAASVGKVVIDPDLYDLDRVEVLRGPQGTLFGSGSMGGAIRLITNAPDLKSFSVGGKTLGSETDGGGWNYGQNGMVNLPLIDNVAALRIVGTYTYTSGWIARIVVPGLAPIGSDGQRGNVYASPASSIVPRVNDEELSSGRASFLLKPTEQLSILASGYYQKIAQEAQNFFDSVPGTLAHFEPFDIPEPFSDTFTVYNLTVNYELPWARLTSATGYTDRVTNTQQDDTESIQEGLSTPGSPLPFQVSQGGFGPVAGTERDRAYQFTQEARLTSSGNGRLQWIVGFFYGRYHANTITELPSPAVPAITGGATDQVAAFSIPYVIYQRAEFANINYQITDQLKFTTGLRHFNYGSTQELSSWGLLNTGSNIPTVSSGIANNSGNNPMFTLAYSPDKGLMLYATAAKGFREGGPNYPLSPPTTSEGQACLQNLQALGLSSAPLQYGPDTVWSYELGEKATFLDHKVTFNSAVYYLNWKDVQQPVSLACGEYFEINATNAYVVGGEYELQAQVGEHFRVHQSTGYAYGAFSEASLAADVTKGERLLNVPNWTVSAALEYFQPLSNDRLLVGRLSDSFVSWSNDLTYVVNKVPSRNVMSLSAGLEKGDLSALLFIDNVLDKHNELANVNSIALNISAYNRVATDQPRTIGVNLNYKF
jgi:iron complex outermembrane recepter protein